MNIVAMGGDERAKAFTKSLELTGHEKVSALILPTACSTQNSYDKKVPLTVNRFKELKVSATVLHEFGENPTSEHLAHELGRASLIYTIGGNTPYLIEQLHAFGGFEALQKVIAEGTLHVGTSAGALLPFEIAHSNIAKRPAEEEWDYAYLPTLGVVPGVATAHADQHDQTRRGERPDSRLEALISTFPESVSVGYAIDNNASLVIKDGEQTAISESPGSTVRVLSRIKNGTIDTKEL